MSNSEIEQSGTVKGHLPNEASLSGRISNGLSLSGHISIGGAGDFIIKMTLASGDDGNCTVASCDATIEQIDEAVAAEKRVVLIASLGGTIFELPMLQGAQGEIYVFGTFLNGQMLTSFVQKVGGNTSEWQFSITQIQAESIDYSNAALPNDVNVKAALDELVSNSHTHANKAVLDKFAETDGKPTYNGEAIGGDITAEDVSYHDSFELGFENVGQTLDALVAGVDATRKDVLRLNKSEHTHSNKAVLDKFAETDGKPTYNGEALGSGSGDFIIKMTVEDNSDDGYTVTSCDATVEQIDAAVAAEKRVVLAVSYIGIIVELPMIQGVQGNFYYFGTFFNGLMMTSSVQKIDGNTSKWNFDAKQIQAESVSYSNDALPNVDNVKTALNALVSKSHNHNNKNILDRLSVSNGKLQYNGSDVGLKGDKGDTPVKGTDYWTAADKQEIIDDIHPAYYIDLAGKYPNYTCPVAMDDIKAAYNAGYNLVCRCQMGVYTATLPLFVPMPAANTWIFSGSGCLQSMGFPAQSFTIAITTNGVVAQNKELVALGGTLPNPYELQITVGDTSYIYDGSEYVNIVIDDGTEVSY